MTNIIIGASGDLGSQLAAQLQDRGVSVQTYGRQNQLSADLILPGEHYLLHLCIPAEAASEYSWLGELPNCLVVLHDSVMSTSRQLGQQYFPQNFVAVHMLMNSQQTIVIDHDSIHAEQIENLATQIGLRPVRLPIDEHDAVMAESQAPLALLCQLIHSPLRQYREQGLLTPSGEELVAALDARASTWTPATIRSLLRNPKLHELVGSMQSTLQDIERDDKSFD